MFRFLLARKVNPGHVADMRAELGDEVRMFLTELGTRLAEARRPADRQAVLDQAEAALYELLAMAYAMGFDP
jgi:predicted peroxiredoxin